MEDYEKKYKDALAKAKEIHRNENEKRFDMEWLFPELKENDDERVKKRILLSLEKDLMATKNSGYDTQDLEQCIAWLEKQGGSVKWQKNTPDNKPAINHSVLMKTTQGIAEGEWQGEYWFQYRWSWTLKDSDVLAWMELSDLDEQGGTKAINDTDEAIKDTSINDMVEPKSKHLFLKKDMSFDEGKLYRCTGIKSKDNIAYVDLEEARINPKEVEYSTMLQSIWGKVCELEGKLGDIYNAISKPYQDIKQPVNIPSNPMQCWFPDGTCMNPYHDCVNCPRPYSNGNKSYTSTTTSINPNEVMYDGNPINDQEKKD